MKRIVVKIGSSVIAPKGKLDSGLVSNLIKDILSIEKKGYKVILVSSGAIACGLNKLKAKNRPQNLHSLMAICSLGQIILMDIFNEKFKKYKRSCAQLLLTWDDFDNRTRFTNIQKTIDKLLEMNIIPIINENDAVSYEEIRVGDNDRLSAFVANLVGAQTLIMLSDVEGLFDGKNLVRLVPTIDSKILSLAKKEDKTHTTGGMFTKLYAAKIAAASGIKTVIAYGRSKKVIHRIVSGESIGTLFLPQDKANKGKKRWIASKNMKNITASFQIDEGAKDAILNKGKSLLSVGIIQIKGTFNKGDAVKVCDSSGVMVGCGLTNYGSESFREGRQEKFEKEVIHRDNFIKAN